MSVPKSTDTYIKYEVSVKVKRFWHKLYGNRIDFQINYPQERGIELTNYTGVNDNNKFYTLASNRLKNAEVILLLPSSTNDKPDKYEISLEFTYSFLEAYNKTITLYTH